MAATVDDIIKIMNGIAPPRLAENWDNVGFLVGRKDTEVKRILVALDLTPEALKQALEQKVQMIITHHPVIFKGLKKISDQDWQQEIILSCIENKIAVFSAHTNLDSAMGGVNDVLAELLEIQEPRVLVANEESEYSGLGRIGFLEEPLELPEFLSRVKKALNIKNIVCADAGQKVHKVAVCGGAGADFIEEALLQGADTYVTGDVKYHDAQNAVFSGLNIVDGTHQATELVIVAHLADKIALRLTQQGFGTQVLQAQEKNLLNVY